MAQLIREGGDQVLAKLRARKSATKAVDDLLPDTEDEAKRWNDALRALYEEVMRDGFVAAVGEDIEEDIRWDLTNPRVVKWLKSRTQQINTIVGNREKELRASLAEGYENGETISQLMGRVREYQDLADYKAARIARTEVVGSSNAGAYAAYEEAGMGREWITTRDGRERDSHAAMDGQAVDKGEKFRSPSGATAYHPGGFGVAAEDVNCFPGDARVLSLSGMQAITRRWHSGVLRQITTASGQHLTGTVNHPILTPRGWLGLGCLDLGDDVIRYLGAQHASASDPNEDNQPPTFREVFDLATFLGTGIRLAGIEEQFHGDGARGDVDIVAPYCLLHDTGDQGDLALTDEIDRRYSLAPLSAAFQFGLATALLSPRGVSSLGQREARFGRRLLHARIHSLAAVARGYALLQQQAADRRSRVAGAFGDSLLGLTGQIVPDKIVGIRELSFSGHVYNLQTGSGWYICNSIIAHNCRCVVAAAKMQ